MNKIQLVLFLTYQYFPDLLFKINTKSKKFLLITIIYIQLFDFQYKLKLSQLPYNRYLQ
jgi:hypothetical protein